MTTDTVAILPALATICHNATKVRRGGRVSGGYSPRAIKAIRPESAPGMLSPECRAALFALVQAGHTVRVYSLGSIYTLQVVDGQLSWDDVRATNSAMREQMVIKVAL